MGFYGQITNSNKASFTFDKTYANRSAMESECQNDGVFLGRYVLIEYDNPAIGVYYNYKLQNGEIYASQALNEESKITAVLNRLYQDIVTGIFYVGLANGKVKAADISADKTPYAYNYNIDVTEYGRGYDSTAWVKRYDTANNTYKYTMIAELNTVVPELHVLIDPPQEKAHTPYWDHESTNLDYYLHLAGNYHDTIKRAASSEVSDEIVNRLNPQWTYDPIKGIEDYKSTTEAINADIFYNKAGFDSNVHKYVTMDDTINFSETSGGRRYATDVFHPHTKVDQLDTREWYIRLPSIGNAICQVWDKMYGEDRNKTAATEREDPKALYDDGTVVGFVNRVRDVLGHTFRKLETNTPSEVSKEDINLYYVTQANSDIPHEYYYYAYSPNFKLSTSGDYYYDSEDKAYKLANKIVTPAENLYEIVDRWELTKLNIPTDDTLYGLIFHLHKLLGTGDVDTRSLDTVHGCINRIKDIIDNIDTQLVPNRLMWTTDEGVIQTSNTQFPSATNDSNRVLTGAGAWENRVRSVSVNAGETSETAWTTSTGTIDTHNNNNNEIDFKAGNKWIGLNINPQSQLIQILHTASALPAHDFATDVTIDDDVNQDNTRQQDCVVTFPVVKTDNAGHVIGYTPQTFYIPYNYRNIKLEAQSSSETELAASNGTQEADASNDTFVFATGNQWIKAKIDEDQITFAHALINDKATQKWQFMPTATEGWKVTADGNKLTIPTFEIDNAGHIVRSNSVDFYIPHNFRNIIVGANGTDVDATQTAGTIEADSTTDTWTIASQNKWLKVAADATNDKITIGHTFSELKAHDFDTDVEIVSALDGTSQTDNKIVLPVLETDNAGHIIGYSTNTFYIPHNFKSIVVESENSDSDADSTQVNGTLVADNIVDSWKIAAQNKWIDIAADATNDRITIGHKYSPEQTYRNDTGDTVNQSPAFGVTFQVPNYETDQAGHITKSSAHTVMIPQNSYTETADKTAGVITTIALTKDAGKFDATRVNVGTLALTEYTYDATNTNKVVNTDSINTAFSKVDAQIAKEITDREKAIDDLSKATTNSITELSNNLATTKSELVASDTDLSNRLTTEATTRESEDIRILEEAQDYTNNAITNLVGGAPQTLNTLNELATALGEDENFAATVAANIGANTTAIGVEKDKIDAHIANKLNPHGVTASQVGLGNVTNESKATMFTNPVFTGVAKLQEDILATEKYVTTVVGKETDARERADQARHEEFTNALAVETQERLNSLEALLNDLITNYGITLNAPEFEVVREDIQEEEKVIMTVSASDECTMIWYKKQLEADPIAVSESAPVGAFDIIEDGEYYCVITRTHNGHTSEVQSEVYNIVVPKLPEPEPEPEPEPTPDPDPEVPEEPEA